MQVHRAARAATGATQEQAGLAQLVKAAFPEPIRARLRVLVRAGFYDLADCGQLAHHHRARPAEVLALIAQAEKAQISNPTLGARA